MLHQLPSLYLLGLTSEVLLVMKQMVLSYLKKNKLAGANSLRRWRNTARFGLSKVLGSKPLWHHNSNNFAEITLMLSQLLSLYLLGLTAKVLLVMKQMLPSYLKKNKLAGANPLRRWWNKVRFGLSKFLGSKLLWHHNSNNFEEITLMLHQLLSLYLLGLISKVLFVMKLMLPSYLERNKYAEMLWKDDETSDIWFVQILRLEATVASEFKQFWRDNLNVICSP